MHEIFQFTTRDIEQDCRDMSAMLTKKGWVLVNGVIQRVAYSNLPLFNKMYPVEEGSISLFSSNEDTQRLIRTSPAKTQDTYMAMPYVLLAHETIRLGLTQIAGGTITGIMRYK